MTAITTLGLWLQARAQRDERGGALVLEATAIGIIGVLLLLAFLPPARTFMTDVVQWVRDNTIGS